MRERLPMDAAGRITCPRECDKGARTKVTSQSDVRSGSMLSKKASP
jgi:hypothetical protein